MRADEEAWPARDTHRPLHSRVSCGVTDTTSHSGAPPPNSAMREVMTRPVGQTIEAVEGAGSRVEDPAPYATTVAITRSHSVGCTILQGVHAVTACVLATEALPVHRHPGMLKMIFS